ncbi:MAG: proprotein convertase P-domain-containing protein [Phycisphaerales bacterium]|nr:proprotein convertase P-domain-containing protein [Phycisphaerales bacterium]
MFTFINSLATTTTVNDNLPGCLGSTVPMVMNNDVWYRWVAPATGVFSHILRSAADGVVAPSVRSAIYDGGAVAGTCPPSGSAPIACSTVPGLVAASVVAGNVYFIQVASTTAGSTGSGRMEFNFVAAATGSCCVGTACTVSSQAQCAAQSGTFGGSGTLCAPATATVNSYTGTGGTTPDFVSPNPGVFTSSITVSDTFPIAGVEVDMTFGHTWVGDLIITLSNGSRTISLSNRAKRGVLIGTATTPSAAGSSSNIGTGTITGTALYTFSDAGTTDFFAASTDSSTFNLVPSPGVIYRPSTSGGISERFTDVFNGQPASGTWTLTFSDYAAGDTGTLTGWTLRLTQGTAPNCAPATIVCCRGVTCAVIAAVDCTAPAGVGISQIPGTTCAGQSAIVAGCCYADFNKSGVKDVADIFAYLSAWFANSPFSDVGGDGTGTRDVSDIFQFLSAWFAGCT